MCRGLVFCGQGPLDDQEVGAPVAEALHEPEAEDDGEPVYGHWVVRRAGVVPGVEVALVVHRLLEPRPSSHVHQPKITSGRRPSVIRKNCNTSL